MLGLLAYGIIALVAAVVVVGGISLVTKVGALGDRSNGPRVLLAWALCFIAPYIWVEANTMMHAGDLEPVVDEAVAEEEVEPDVVSTKVQYMLGGKARLIVIARTTEQEWGTYRNIYGITATYDGENWHLVSVTPINTEEGDSAGFTFPPYW
ncbi:MAG: hypothetical protein AB1725_00355 [Armatimonadota bacterium]